MGPAQLDSQKHQQSLNFSALLSATADLPPPLSFEAC